MRDEMSRDESQRDINNKKLLSYFLMAGVRDGRSKHFARRCRQSSVVYWAGAAALNGRRRVVCVFTRLFHRLSGGALVLMLAAALLLWPWYFKKPKAGENDEIQ